MFIQSVEAGYEVSGDAAAEAVTAFKRALQYGKNDLELFELFGYVRDICGTAVKPLVLIIDESDSAADNQVFLDFLAQLRAYYIDRDKTPTFQSVILAGVYDIKKMKREKQLADYLEYYHLEKGYMLSFSFNKKKQIGVRRIKIGTKTVVEAVV